jgi:hypothetical protein
MTFFIFKLIPYLQVAIVGMKRNTLFLDKKVTVTCKKSMGDANEYQELLEPPPKSKKIGLLGRVN